MRSIVDFTIILSLVPVSCLTFDSAQHTDLTGVKNKKGIRSMQVYTQTQRTVVGLQLFNGTGEKFLRQNLLGYVTYVVDSSHSVRYRLRTHPNFANGKTVTLSTKRFSQQRKEQYSNDRLMTTKIWDFLLIF
jgi:hypothetical protein